MEVLASSKRLSFIGTDNQFRVRGRDQNPGRLQVAG